MKPDEAEDAARAALKAIKKGDDRAGPQRFGAVAELWFQRHVEKNALRWRKHIRCYLDRHLLPTWAGREFTSIRRGDVTQLLDAIEGGAQLRARWLTSRTL